MKMLSSPLKKTNQNRTSVLNSETENVAKRGKYQISAINYEVQLSYDIVNSISQQYFPNPNAETLHSSHNNWT